MATASPPKRFQNELRRKNTETARERESAIVPSFPWEWDAPFPIRFRMREKFPSLLLVGIASKNKELHFGGATAAAIGAEARSGP